MPPSDLVSLSATLQWLDEKPGRQLVVTRMGEGMSVTIYRSNNELSPVSLDMQIYRCTRATAGDALAQCMTAALADDDYLSRKVPAAPKAL